MRLMYHGLVACLLLSVASGRSLSAEPTSAIPPNAQAGDGLPFLVRINYMGWENSILMSNGQVEAVVVPQIGRIMQFRQAGEEDGPFWVNPSLHGQLADITSTNWSNFGGDKAWPAPQANWEKITSRAWPPPVGFDASQCRAEVVDGWNVRLTSPADPSYGIQTIRDIKLVPNQPAMQVRTTFRKLAGDANLVSIWVITQLKDPVRVISARPRESRLGPGVQLLSTDKPPTLEATPTYISLERDPQTDYKIGTDSWFLAWIGENQVLTIESARGFLDPYPDEGSSTEIFTASNPLGAYVELEFLGPLRKMMPGDTIQRVSTYTLQPRREFDPSFEAEILVAEQPR